MSHEHLKYIEAAAFLNVPVGTLYAMVSRGTIPHIRISRRLVRFSKKELEQWLKERSTGAGVSR